MMTGVGTVGAAEQGRPPLILERELPQGTFLDNNVGTGHYLIWRSKTLIESFASATQGGGWEWLTRNSDHSGQLLWMGKEEKKPLISIPFEQTVIAGRFSSDAFQIVAQQLVVDERKVRTMSFDRQGRRLVERFDSFDIHIVAPLAEDVVLARMGARASPSEWRHIRISDNKLLLQSDPAPQEDRWVSGDLAGPLISVLYGMIFQAHSVSSTDERVLRARRIKDLRSTWEFPIRRGDSLFGMSLSPDGEWLGVSCGKMVSRDEDEQNCFVYIINVESGNVVNKVPVNGTDKIAISAQGRYLAVGVRTVHGRRSVDMKVSLYDIASKRKLGEVLHEKVNTERTALLSRFDKLDFSRDSKHLFAFAHHSKLWRVASE